MFVPSIPAPGNNSAAGPIDAAAVIRATLAAFSADGALRVLLPGGQESVAALAAIALSEKDVGAALLLAIPLRHGDLPVITGRCDEHGRRKRRRVEAERLLLEAEHDIELRCGEASLVLTRAGKVLIRGNFVLTHARGANRIRGACVQIN